MELKTDQELKQDKYIVEAEDISDDDFLSCVKLIENDLEPHEVFSQPMPSQLRLPDKKFQRFRTPKSDAEMQELAKKGLVLNLVLFAKFHHSLSNFFFPIQVPSLFLNHVR